MKALSDFLTTVGAVIFSCWMLGMFCELVFRWVKEYHED